MFGFLGIKFYNFLCLILNLITQILKRNIMPAGSDNYAMQIMSSSK